MRALVIGSADVGELVMRAFILRRVALLEAGNTGSVLVGASGSRDLMRLQSFLSRNGYPLTVLNAEATGEGRDLLERMGVRDDELPLMLCPDGTVLKRPTERQAAACLGITPDLHADMLYDVAVVGAGPAGLATAVYAASEGLKVIVLEKAAFGGQAGASARIENYLGFPTGISGRALAGRAFNQALKFGAEVAVPLQVARLDCEGSANPDGRLRLELDGEAAPLHAKTIVIASGALYRRPAIANLEQFEGSGVSYWASPLEAKLCEGEEVALVGAGNSAGQAVVFLASKVKRLHMIVRGEGLAASMSAYLIDRISALPNVEIHTLTECTGLEGEPNGVLKRVRFTRHDTGETTVRDLHHLFLFIGADPNTAWVKDCVELDHHGFIRTGEAVHGAGERPVVRSLETSRRRVFAVGDVRSASTKRVGAAIGEGAAVVAQIHAALAEG